MTPDPTRAHDIERYAATLHNASKIGTEAVWLAEAIADAIRKGRPLSPPIPTTTEKPE